MKQVEFFKNCGHLIAKPVTGGWLLKSNSNTLDTARGGERVFKQLDTVAKVCQENGEKSFSVNM